ncbi:MAG: hypothetical protein QM817_41260 [Archangium sp.]
MSRRKAEDALQKATKQDNAFWFAARGLSFLTRAVEPRLVAPAMKLLATRGRLLPHLKKLPVEFDALAIEALRASDTVESAFFAAWNGDVRSAGAWSHQLDMVYDKKSAPRLAKLVTAQAVEAAQSTVAAKGMAAARLLCVLAHDGSESSADIVLPLLVSALKTRDRSLDALKQWVVPFARGPHFTKLVAELQRATGEREATTSPLRAWLESLGVEGSSVHFELAFHSSNDKWSLWLKLDSKRLPHVLLALSNTTGSYFSAEDFKVRHAKKVTFKPPNSLEEVPAWLVSVSKRERITWRAKPQWVKSSLRGKARERAVAWLRSSSR